MQENILVMCPGCQLKFKVPVHLIGKRARCNGCQSIFVLEAPSEMLEDTVAEWLFDGAATPKPAAATATTGDDSSGATAATQAASAATAVQPATARPASKAALEPVRLERIDDMGAYFEFPCERLAQPQLRASFSRKCISCSSQEDLSVHLLIWPDRLPPRDQIRMHETELQKAGKLAEYGEDAGEALLAKLPELKILPAPYSKPFPYYVCPNCSAVGEVLTHVLSHGQREYCQIMIANLEIAAEFLVANGGADSEDYQLVLEAWQHQKQDPWRTLPLSVRNRLNNWYEKRPDERFVEYFPDAEFSKAELGTAGMVLTNRRAIFKKFAAQREFDMHKPTNLRCMPAEDRWRMEFSQTGTRAATLSLSPHGADRFIRKCRSLYTGLHIAEQQAAAAPET